MLGGVAKWAGGLFIATVALGEVPPGYYSLAEGKTGPELRRELHFIISGHRVIPYSDATRPDTSDALKELDQDPNETNNVVLIYSGVSTAKTNFGDTVGWNREHLWPNSYGLDDREPAFSDLHNLRACDATVNSSRGNKFYDVAIAEFERSIIRERVTAGLRAAKAKGVRLGRPSTLNRYQEQVNELVAQGLGVRAIARTLSIPIGSAHKLIKEAKKRTT